MRQNIQSIEFLYFNLTQTTFQIYNAENGTHIHKVSLRSCGIKENVLKVISLPHKATQVAVITSEKGSIIDIKSKKYIRSVPKWDGSCTKDGKFGLYAPARCENFAYMKMFLIFF